MSESSRSTSGQLLRFISDPKDFSGSTVQDTANKVNPVGWLKKLDRLKDLAKLSDSQILIIAADHLVGKAGIWFDIIGSTATTWNSFSVMFKRKYCAGLEDIYWSQIKDLKQLPGETVEDVDVRLRELYMLVEVKDEKMMIRTFMDAINPRIAYEVERGSELKAISRTLDDLVSIATRVEQVNLKYLDKGIDTFSTSSLISKYDQQTNDKPKEVTQNVHSDSDTINELLREFKEMKINMVNSTRNQAPRTMICFYCNESGHKKPECPKLHDQRNNHQSNPATGPNAIPITNSNNRQGSSEDAGKDNEYHQ